MKASFKKLFFRINAKIFGISKSDSAADPARWGALLSGRIYLSQKVTHRNLPLTEAAALCLALCEQDFKQINIFTPTEQIQVLAARPERPAIRRTPQAEQAERGKNFGARAAAAVTISTVSRQSAAAAAILTAKEEIAAATVLIPNSQTVSRPVFTVKAARPYRFCRRVRGVRALAQPPKALSDSGRCALRLSDSPRRDESGGKGFSEVLREIPPNQPLS